MVVKKAKPLAIECIVRGYITGSGWKEYLKQGTVCDIRCPKVCWNPQSWRNRCSPSTKADEGHDENISFEKAVDIVGQETAEKVRDLSLKIYTEARNYARERGIIIADTKFEFGELDGELILIDEVLTPDSSRFWPLDEYEPGRGQFSFDKQYVRDYLETLDWDKTPPDQPASRPRGTLPGSIPRGLRAAHRSGSVNAAVDDFLQHIRLEKGSPPRRKRPMPRCSVVLLTGPRPLVLAVGKTSNATISRNFSSTNATARP